MQNFVNLHVHSAYSLLDGMSRPEDIVKKVKNMKQPAVAITEHGNVYSAVKMFKLCRKEDIKFIYGCEFYMAPKSRFDKDPKNKYYHLTVLATNEQGRLNINKLVTLGNLEGFYYKPRIDFELLSEHKEGLLILSGCMASELQRTLRDQGYDKAKEVARRFHKVFGDNYYLEVQSHRDELQQKLNRQIVDIAKELGIQWVCTADSHFVDEDDLELHSIFIQIGTNREPGETYVDTQLQSEEEARKLLKPALTDEEIDIALRNTLVIMDKCKVEIPLSAPLIPHVSVPDGFKSEEDYLKHLCKKGWKEREFHKLPKEKQKIYKERLNYEYKAIKEMGFAGYYLLVQSYANTVKRRGIARGSGGGSLVAYLLNIVDCDPIEYGLYFERFIDVGALDLLREGKITKKELKVPDVDLDFGREDRDKVIKYIVDTYGRDRVASIGNFQYIWAKTAIKDIGRVLGIPFDITNQITKGIEEATKGTDVNIKTIEEARELDLLGDWEEKYPKLFRYAEKIAGLPKAFSMHPCGRVITLDETTYYTAVEENDGQIVFQADMYDVEDLGLVKIDALGLRTVDVIYDVLDMIGKDYDYIKPQTMNFQDEKVLDLFKQGHTDGIFQFESDGMRKTLQKMQPTGLTDIAAANALYRPGAMKYIDDYCKRKRGEIEIEYLHPDLEEILKPTYGIIVFQEQLIEIGRLAGLRNPDKLRKATGKKIRSLMDEIKPELENGLLKRGWSSEQVEKLWNDMLDFAKYSFNKSHSVAYAITAYITAFLKAYHPAEFICSNLNSLIEGSGDGKKKKIDRCFKEARRLGIEFAEPDYRNVTPLCTIKDGKVVIGTALIKNCNEMTAKELSKLNSNYDSFVDLLVDVEEKTAINKTQMTTLITLNYFKQYGGSKKLLSIYEAFKDGKGVKYTKTYSDKTKQKRIEALKQIEQETKDEKLSVPDQLMAELDCYKSILSIYPNLKNTISVVLEINQKYTPKITLYQLKTGKEAVVKVEKKKFFDEKGDPRLQVGDIINIRKVSKKPKKQKINDEWVELKDEFDLYLTSSAKIDPDKFII